MSFGILLLILGSAFASQKFGLVDASKIRANAATKIETASVGSLLQSLGNMAMSVVSDKQPIHEKAGHESAGHDQKSDEHSGQEQGHHSQLKIIVTSPKVMEVTVTQPYVCQIRSRRHIEVCALEKGYLEEVLVKEGQSVKKGDLMFKILPTLYQAKLDAEVAEAKLVELEYNYTKTLADKKVVSQNEVLLLEAKLAKAKAIVKMAQAELNFTNVIAPFDGIVDNLHKQLGSLIAEGDILTTLSDNNVMWVYYNVPEAAYLEYKENLGRKDQEERIELVLANGKKFSEVGKIGAIEAKFNNQTGNIQFRADYENPAGLLRHGQTGTLLIKHVLKNAIVIPQRATFELLDKRYVFTVDQKNVAHQRLITVENEKDDIFIVRSGLAATDRIVVDGARDVKEGGEIEFDQKTPEEVLKNLKNRAE